MSEDKKNKKKIEDLTKKVDRDNEEKPDFGGWLFRKEGTVAEPRTTAEEFLKDKKAQDEIKRVRKILYPLKKETK